MYKNIAVKLISNPIELSKEFKRLMHHYKEYLWAVAWADYNFELSNLLVAKKERINKVIVGLNFFGTHPSFLQKFYLHKGVRFLGPTNGTYHPKLYLFRNSITDWELLIGSGNFTKAAFKNNIELSILISSKDKSIGNIFENTIEFIDEQWRKGKILTKENIDEYKFQKSKIKRPKYPDLPTKGSMNSVLELTWQNYMSELKKKDYKSRIKFLNWVKEQFSKKGQFHKIDPHIRKSIAGFGSGEYKVEIGCFGTTGRRYSFMHAVNETPEIISNALNKIPKRGIVLKSDYENFIKSFSAVSKQNEFACATRLLCLWRPDYFINFNGKNKDRLCKRLQIKTSKVNYKTYWDLIVEPFIDSTWGKKVKLSSQTEKQIYDYRVALMDCICYEE